MQRQRDTDHFNGLPEGAITEAGNHPYAIPMDGGQARLAEDPFKLADGKRSLPPGKPSVDGDQHMLDHGIHMKPLWNIDEQQPTRFEYADIFLNESCCIRFTKMFK